MGSDIDSRDDTSDDVNWDEIVYHEEQEEERIHLDLHDYVALFIAAIETIFLPLVVIGIVMIIMAFLIVFLW